MADKKGTTDAAGTDSQPAEEVVDATASESGAEAAAEEATTGAEDASGEAGDAEAEEGEGNGGDAAEGGPDADGEGEGEGEAGSPDADGAEEVVAKGPNGCLTDANCIRPEHEATPLAHSYGRQTGPIS